MRLKQIRFCVPGGQAEAQRATKLSVQMSPTLFATRPTANIGEREHEDEDVHAEMDDLGNVLRMMQLKSS